MKKLIALSLALVLMLSILPTAFAGGAGYYRICYYVPSDGYWYSANKIKTMKPSETKNLEVSCEGEAAYSTIWKSSNPTVATVDQNGKLTALNAGTVTITANFAPYWNSDKRRELTFTFTVVDTRPKLAGKIAVYVGESTQWKADRWVWWTSGNPGVATIDQKGNIKANRAGKTHITATAADGSKITITFFVYNRAY